MRREELDTIKKLKEGDKQTYTKLFREYYVSLCVYANRYLGDKHMAEDIVSDTFYNIWRNRKKIDIKVSLKSYLFQAVVKNSLNYLRKTQREIRMEEYLPKNGKEISTISGTRVELPLEYLINKDLGEKIAQAVEKLPPQQQTAFRLKRYQEKKNREIAEIMGLSEKTVEMHLNKASVALRRHLKDFIRSSAALMLIRELYNFF